MMNVLEKFQNLDADLSLIGLEKGDSEGGYFCTPVGAEVIGWECEGIHYCFIDGFGEMLRVFTSDDISEVFYQRTDGRLDTVFC